MGNFVSKVPVPGLEHFTRLRQGEGAHWPTLGATMKIPDTYVKLWNQYVPNLRAARPLLTTAAGVAIFTAGISIGRLLHTLTQG